jgi:guanylate kinase
MTEKTGKIIFISGPSGVGKGTVIDALRKNHPDFLFPPSCTTRDPRPGEVEGETYFFITREKFQKKIKSREFLEYACVHGGHFYGTLKQPLLDGVKKGKTVIREFDVQGFEQAQTRLPREIFTSIFLKPDEPLDALVQRIRERAPISDEEVEKRIKSMEQELSKVDLYHHVVLSRGGDITTLIQNVEHIIAEETA